MATADLPASDIEVLRELGRWQAGAAASARNRSTVDAWYAHDERARGRRPMVIMEVRNWQGRHGPVPDEALRCRDPFARALEYRMRMLRHHVEVLGDDHVVPADVSFALPVSRGDFGVPGARHREDGADGLAFNYRPALTRLDDEEFARLHPRTPRCERAEIARTRARLEAVFDGLLPVRVRDDPWQFAVPLTSTALDLVGLEGFMLLMYDNPAGLHRLMAFLRDDQAAFLDWLEAEELLPLNNGADNVGAGSIGFTRDLPARDFAGHVRCRDRWGGFESQESVSISPAQYGEFVFPYLEPLMARFGKVYYGCCEPVHPIWEYLARVPALARVSVSPWADEESVGARCRARGIVYSRKPSPNYLSGERFDAGALADHFARTVDAARGCSLKIVQRDIYVTHEEPDRLRRWVEIARDACRAWRE